MSSNVQSGTKNTQAVEGDPEVGRSIRNGRLRNGGDENKTQENGKSG